MAEAGNEFITDWISPAEAWRLLTERWGDPNVCLGLVRKALAEGMPWQCRYVENGAEKDPDLFCGRSQFSWKEGWAQAFPSPGQAGPRHWFALSRAWVLALPGTPSDPGEDDSHPTKIWIVAEARRMKNADEIPTDKTDFAKALAQRMREAAKLDRSIRPIKWTSIMNKLAEWGLWPPDLIK